MGVLNNSEIKAVANKILKKLQQLKEEKRQDLIDNYVPSDLYNELDGYLTQADYLKSEIDQCQKNIQYINKCIDQLISEHELKTKFSPMFAIIRSCFKSSIVGSSSTGYSLSITD